MSLAQRVAQQWDGFSRRHREKKVRTILCRPFFSNYTTDERDLLSRVMSTRRYYDDFLSAHNNFSSFFYASSYNQDAIFHYETRGYCAHSLNEETLRAIRTSMDLYCRTGDRQYFVRRFHKDILFPDMSRDIVDHYWKKRHLSLDSISLVLSEKYGIRIPAYQISRIARRQLPSFLWRRRPG